MAVKPTCWLAAGRGAKVLHSTSLQPAKLRRQLKKTINQLSVATARTTKTVIVTQLGDSYITSH